MAELQLKRIEKRYQDTPVIHGVDLTIADGEFAVFVGPSGCGKSTLLRMIAGLEEISGGDLYIGGVRANDLPPAQRGVAMVFQSYALYPHMTVAENMGFSLRLSGEPKDKIRAAVGRAAEILQISHLLDRKPKALSGGQRQRVAIGRAIVRTPQVFLFDEPLSNLDAALRVQMRIELSRLAAELKTTMIYVTHDQVEAMTLGDRIVVLNGGHIEQVGSPLALYDRPANRFVAGFLGSPRMNFLRAEWVAEAGGGAVVRLGHGGTLHLPATQRPAEQGAELRLGIRPEHLTLAPRGEGLPVRVDLVEHLGDSAVAYVELAGSGEGLGVRLGGQLTGLGRGDEVALHVDPRHCHLFDAGGRRLHAG